MPKSVYFRPLLWFPITHSARIQFACRVAGSVPLSISQFCPLDSESRLKELYEALLSSEFRSCVKVDGGRPGLFVPMSLSFCGREATLTMLTHWSQFVPNMSADIRGHEALHHHLLSIQPVENQPVEISDQPACRDPSIHLRSRILFGNAPFVVYSCSWLTSDSNSGTGSKYVRIYNLYVCL